MIFKRYLEPRYFAVNGMDSQGLIYKHLKIDDMRDKWTTIIFHTKMSKDFIKMYVEMSFTMIIKAGQVFYHSWISRWNDKRIMKFFRTSSF